MTRALLFCILLFTSVIARAEVRTWTDSTGKFKVEAEFVDLSQSVVRLKKSDGQVISVALEKLSEADQTHVRAIAAQPGKAPAARERQLVIVSEETTHWIAPLDAAGRLDFVEALNAETGAGVDASSNAAIEFWQAVGLEGCDRSVRERVARMPGFTSSSQPTFVDWAPFLAQSGGGAGRRESAGAGVSVSNDVRCWPWQAAAHPQEAAWLQQNQQALDLVVRAVQKPRFCSPIVRDPANPGVAGAQLPHGVAARAVAQALIARAMLSLGTGDMPAAWQDTLACHRLARLIGQGPTAMEAMVASAIDEIACDAALAIAHHDRLTEETAMRCLADVKSLAPMPAVSDKVDRGERAVLLDTACSVAQGGPRELFRQCIIASGSEFQPDMVGGFVERWSTKSAPNWSEVLRSLNQDFDNWVGATRDGSAESRSRLAQASQSPENNSLFVHWQQQPQVLARGELPAALPPRAVGELLIAVRKLEFYQICTAEARYRVRECMLPLAMALGAARAKHGSYPTALTQLTPAILDQLPRDSFSGAEVRYESRPPGFVLYSVGLDPAQRSGANNTAGSNREVVLQVPFVRQN